MPEKKIVHTSRAPAAVGPYSQAVCAGGMIYVSGQIPLDPRNGQMVEAPLAEQTELVLNSVGEILREAGASLSDVVKVTVYLKDLQRFGEMNEVYARFFPDEQPARVTVQVAELPKGAPLEIEVIALDSRGQP